MGTIYELLHFYSPYFRLIFTANLNWVKFLCNSFWIAWCCAICHLNMYVLFPLRLECHFPPSIHPTAHFPMAQTSCSPLSTHLLLAHALAVQRRTKPGLHSPTGGIPTDRQSAFGPLIPLQHLQHTSFARHWCWEARAMKSRSREKSCTDLEDILFSGNFLWLLCLVYECFF